jgi:hypothetical protein
LTIVSVRHPAGATRDDAVGEVSAALFAAALVVEPRVGVLLLLLVAEGVGALVTGLALARGVALVLELDETWAAAAWTGGVADCARA